MSSGPAINERSPTSRNLPSRRPKGPLLAEISNHCSPNIGCDRPDGQHDDGEPPTGRSNIGREDEQAEHLEDQAGNQDSLAARSVGEATGGERRDESDSTPKSQS